MRLQRREETPKFIKLNPPLPWYLNGLFNDLTKTKTNFIVAGSHEYKETYILYKLTAVVSKVSSLCG